jgi:hypothetical protein
LAIGDTVELSGEVVSIDELGRVVLELAATRDGQALVSGRATVVVRTR